MSVISINTPKGLFNFEIQGETPTIEEKLKIKNFLQKLPRQRVESQQSPKSEIISSKESKQPQFDTKTGIRDFKLRAALSGAENNSEQELILNKFGLGAEDFTRDKRNRLALTPTGASKFNVETDKNVLIDESGFSRYDFADMAGILPEVGGAIAGSLKGAAIGTAIAPGLGTLLGTVGGGAFGAGSGSLAEEAIEGIAGVSDQKASEILKDAGKEAVIAGTGELLFGAPFLIFKSLRPSSKLAKEGGEKLDIVAEGTRRGYAFPAKTYGVGPIAQKSEELLGSVIGTTPALSQSRKQLTKDIKKYQEKRKQFEELSGNEDFGTLLTNLPKNKTQQIVNQSNVIRNKLNADLKKVVNTTEDSVKSNKVLNEDLFNEISLSMKNFDDNITQSFIDIDNVIKTSVGDKKFIPTASISEISENVKKTLDNTFGDIEKENVYKFLIQSFEPLASGVKTDFSTLYKYRKSLSDISLKNKPKNIDNKIFNTIINDDKLLSYVNIYKDEIDKLLTLNIDDLKQIKNLTEEQAKKLQKASVSLNPARKEYAQGMELYDKIATNMSSKKLVQSFKQARDAIKDGKTFNIPKDDLIQATNLIKNNNKTPLLTLKEALKNTDGKDGLSIYNNFKDRIADDFLKKQLSTSSFKASDPTSFNSLGYFQSLKELGETGEELFGKNKYQSLLKQAEDIDLLGPTKISQSVIDDTIINRTSLDLKDINDLKEIIKEDKFLKTNGIIKKIRDKKGTDVPISPRTAVEIITDNNIDINQLDEIIKHFAKDETTLNSIRKTYIENMLEGIGPNFDAKVLRNFSDNISKLDGIDKLGRPKKKLDVIFSPEEAKDMREFGKILRILADDIGNANLVAAGITANFLGQIPKIARITIIGNLFTSSKARQQVLDAAKMAEGKSGKKATEIIGNALMSAIRQIAVQSTDTGVQEAKSQIQGLVENTEIGKELQNISNNLQSPSPVSSLGDLNLTTPPINTQPIINNQTNLRQRATQNPAVANTLLGGLGNASILNTS